MKNFITPGSTIKICTGRGKGLEKTVLRVQNAYLVLKDYLKDSLQKKLYNVKVHRSNCTLVKRNYKPPKQ